MIVRLYNTIFFRNYNWYFSIRRIKFVSPLTTRISVFLLPPLVARDVVTPVYLGNCEPLSTGRPNMDVIHKKVLASKTTVIMNSITSPTRIAAQLGTVFCPSDKEEIKATENRLGSIHASQTLLSLLEKRGPKAFDKFLTVLKNPDNLLTHLADDILDAERELRGEQGQWAVFASFNSLKNFSELQSQRILQ